jgi:glycosyltransferase involved in cell wall biosynthesis
VRLCVYSDYPYQRLPEGISASRSFALFINEVGNHLGGVVLMGRLDPSAPAMRHPVAADSRFVALPYYESLARPLDVLRTTLGSLRRCWRALDDIDCIWIMGPHPFAIAFAALAVSRRKRVALGVRQNWPAYIRRRRPGRPGLWVAAGLMEAAFRGLALLFPVVAVGPDLARRYRHARPVLEVTVSLVDEGDIVPPEDAMRRAYDQELRLLSVGRLEEDKNPLLLADVLARLREIDSRWRLIVCGEGRMEAELQGRLRGLGLTQFSELRGYVPFGPDLMAVYRTSHAFLHASWTEGLPQVLLEAFAAGLPVIATDVGGVRDAVNGRVRLIPPNDVDAAARELTAIVRERKLRAALIRAGHEYVRSRTLSREAGRVAELLTEGTAVARESADLPQPGHISA